LGGYLITEPAGARSGSYLDIFADIKPWMNKYRSGSRFVIQHYGSGSRRPIHYILKGFGTLEKGSKRFKEKEKDYEVRDKLHEEVRRKK
jgi:hypothetical protein